MKIIDVKVEKLFGVFDHSLPLNTKSGITIVIGENGLGKTVILESINAFFGKDYRFFRAIDFLKISFLFDNDEIWEVTKKNNSDSFSLFVARHFSGKNTTKSKPIKIYQDLREGARKSVSKRELEARWFHDRMYFEKVYERDLERQLKSELEREYEYKKFIEMTHRYRFDEDVEFPKWFSDGIEKIKVKLIETQRITIKERGSDSYVNNVQKSSQDIKKMIEDASKEVSSVTSELDSTYPNRLVNKLRQGNHDSLDELKSALADLTERRRELSMVGLNVKIGDSDLFYIEESQADLVNVLKLYIDDSHKKLDPFKDLSSKIRLFKEIINKRFKHKTLEIKHDDGLVFRSTVVKDAQGEFEIIPPSKLSSGEQNELILFYKLIFNSAPNDMILIDEPELSLHISWQNNFIKDLKSITSINNVSIVIATHSPDIIHDNWDLRIELLGVQ